MRLIGGEFFGKQIFEMLYVFGRKGEMYVGVVAGIRAIVGGFYQMLFYCGAFIGLVVMKFQKGFWQGGIIEARWIEEIIENGVVIVLCQTNFKVFSVLLHGHKQVAIKGELFDVIEKPGH